jgi:hypothetical protein
LRPGTVTGLRAGALVFSTYTLFSPGWMKGNCPPR